MTVAAGSTDAMATQPEDAAALPPEKSAARPGNVDVVVPSPSLSVVAAGDTRPTVVASASLPAVELPVDRQFFGVYGAPIRTSEERPLAVDHSFISWDKPEEMTQFIASARLRQRTPLITIEPWTTASQESRNVLLDTARGSNDAVIQADALAIKAQAPQVVMVRFAHEMELTGNYPWAIANPGLYVEAYRHYVDLFRDEGVTNVRWVWSPAGNGDAPEFYPGDAYADFVGLTILSNKAWDVAVGATDALSFEELFDVKYATLSRFGKPMVIAEFGSANDGEGRQAAWLRDAYAAFARYPLLRGVVYFNAMNAPNSWTGVTPDFRIPGTLLWPEGIALPPEPPRGRPR